MRIRAALLALCAALAAAVVLGPQAPARKLAPQQRSPRSVPSFRREPILSRRRWDQMTARRARDTNARRRWLASSRARAQRTASLSAYRGLSNTRARQVATAQFGSFFKQVGASPAASLATQGRVIKYLNNDTAVVRSPTGQRLLEHSTTPLRSGGQPINLALRKTPDGFSPTRSPEHLSIASTLSAGISVGPGVRFILQGQRTRALEGSQNSVIYPNVATDLDATATPTATGVDLAAIARSANSPHVLRYRVALPAGLILKSSGSNGAAVMRGSTPVLKVLPPAAHDAQGTPAPVHMRVAGNRLVLQIARTRHVAYPVLVDPQITVPVLSPGWQFTKGFCYVDPPGGPFQAPRPGEIDVPPGTYEKLQCPAWTWQAASAGLDHMTRVELDDINWDPTYDFSWNAGPTQPYDDSRSWDCSTAWSSPSPTNADQAWAGSAVWSGNNCGTTVNISLFAAPGQGTQTFVSGPGSLTVGAALVTAPYLPAPSAPELFGGGNPGEPDMTQCAAGFPVDCASGNMFETDTDLALHGHGPPLAINRTYNAQAAASQSTPGPLGYGWSGAYGEHLIVDASAGTVTVVQANGSEVNYDGTSGTLAPEGAWVKATLHVNADGTYTYTLPNQQTEHFAATGRLTTQSDRYGNTLTCAYDSSGRLASVTDGAGRQITLAHNPDGTINQATGPMGSVSYTYDAGGNLTHVTGLNGGTWSYSYDASHRMTSETDPLGHTVTTTYDGNDRVTSQTDGAQRERDWAYSSDPSSETTATTITNPGGDVTYEVFNQAGEPTLITRGYGSASATTKRLAYDSAYELQYLKDGNGHQWAYTYDANGNRSSVTDPLGNQSFWNFDATNGLTSTTDPLNHTTTFTYSNGKLSTVTRQLSETGATQTTAYAYNAHGDLTSITDPRYKQTTYGYDDAGDLTSATAPSGDTTTWTFDGSGYLAGMVTPAGNAAGGNPAQHTTTYENNPDGQPTQITGPLGRVLHLTYNDDGDVLSAKSPANKTTTYAYDADNELTDVQRPDGSDLTTAYTDDGQIASQTTGGHETAYGYNQAGDQTSATDALHRETDYSYDGAGNLATETDPAGRITTYGYDDANNLTSISYSDGTTPGVAYGYDADGRPISMSDGNGTTSYSYDSLGRLTDTTDGNGQHVGYGYDLADNVTSLTYPNNETVTKTYDDSERLASVTDWQGNTTSFAYDPDANLQTTTFPSSTDDVDHYRYDQADQLTNIDVNHSGATLASIAYTSTPAGQIATATEGGLPEPPRNTDTYAYDSADRLTKLDNATGYSYDAASELTSSPSATYSYNDLGDRTQTSPSSGGATGYSYDQAERLIKYTPATGDATTYAYSGDGLRTSKTTGTSATTFAWDRSQPVPALLSDGHNSYLYGPDGLPLEQIPSTGTPQYLHHDRLGSTRLITDSSGNAAGGYSYTPYGLIAAHTGDATTPLQYAGQYTDAESGLVYLRARYYDPSTGQFLTRDPAESLTREPYAYAFDDPTNLTDPSGRDPLIAGGCAAGAVIAPPEGCAIGAGAGALASGVLAGVAALGSLFASDSGDQGNQGHAANPANGAAEESAPGLPGPADVNEATGAECAPSVSATADGGSIIETEGGKTIRIPGDYVASPSTSGGGTIYRPPGNPPGDLANGYRVMPGSSAYPNGYVIEYDEYGHPVDPEGNVPQNRGDYHQPLAP
jgi:RHS repeat-associated protein